MDKSVAEVKQGVLLLYNEEPKGQKESKWLTKTIQKSPERSEKLYSVG